MGYLPTAEAEEVTEDSVELCVEIEEVVKEEAVLDSDETSIGVEVEVAAISTKAPPVPLVSEDDIVDGDAQGNEELSHEYAVTVISPPSSWARTENTSCRARSTWNNTCMRENAMVSILLYTRTVE